MKLDFSQCKTKEDVEAVMRQATPQIKLLKESFDNVFSGRLSSKDAGLENPPRTLKEER